MVYENIHLQLKIPGSRGKHDLIKRSTHCRVFLVTGRKVQEPGTNIVWLRAFHFFLLLLCEVPFSKLGLWGTVWQHENTYTGLGWRVRGKDSGTALGECGWDVCPGAVSRMGSGFTRQAIPADLVTWARFWPCLRLSYRNTSQACSASWWSGRW